MIAMPSFYIKLKSAGHDVSIKIYYYSVTIYATAKVKKYKCSLWETLNLVILDKRDKDEEMIVYYKEKHLCGYSDDLTELRCMRG